jgi:hypothetical protein
MKDAMILKQKSRQEFMDLLYEYIWGKTEYGVVAFNECPTDSEHVHRLSIFICDKEHDPKDLRWADEIKQYFEAHFPEEEAPEPLTVGKI